MARFWGKPCNMSSGGPEPPNVQAISVPATLTTLCSNPSNMIDCRYLRRSGEVGSPKCAFHDAFAVVFLVYGGKCHRRPTNHSHDRHRRLGGDNDAHFLGAVAESSRAIRRQRGPIVSRSTMEAAEKT